MTFDQLLKSMQPSFWFPRGRGLRITYLQRYLDANGDPNALDDHRWTLLHHAADDANPAAIQLLLARGADINACDDLGRTPLQFAVDADLDTASYDGRRPLEMLTTRALINAGADESIRDSTGQSPRDVALAYHQPHLYDAISRLPRPQ